MASGALDSNDARSGGGEWRTFSPVWLIAGLIVIVLFAGYWFFIRTAYVPLLTNVAPQDAVDIVKVLEERKIPYQLADEGRTISVASDKADAARIELVGSELPMRGQVGFELFNQSDMGLTEFAQKINYQRALQGELARTILLLDGIEAVRVHLGLPERGVFRDEEAQPKASVTLLLKPGTTLTEGTVAGIQRMVAGAVPQMRVDNVSVLDGSGRVISTGSPVPTGASSGSDALLENYRVRISAEVSRQYPGLQYGLNLSLHPLAGMLPGGVNDAGERARQPSDDQPAARGEPDFAITVRVTTPSALDENQRFELLRLIRDIVDFNPARSDVIQFLVGEIPPVVSPGVVPAAESDRIVARAAKPPNAATMSLWDRYWPLAVLAGVGLLLAAWLRDRLRSGKRRREELTTFTEQLRQRLEVSHGGVS